MLIYVHNCLCTFRYVSPSIHIHRYIHHNVQCVHLHKIVLHIEQWVNTNVDAHTNAACMNGFIDPCMRTFTVDFYNTRISIHMRTYIHANKRTYTHTYMHTYAHAHIYTHMIHYTFYIPYITDASGKYHWCWWHTYTHSHNRSRIHRYSANTHACAYVNHTYLHKYVIMCKQTNTLCTENCTT